MASWFVLGAIGPEPVPDPLSPSRPWVLRGSLGLLRPVQEIDVRLDGDIEHFEIEVAVVVDLNDGVAAHMDLKTSREQLPRLYGIVDSGCPRPPGRSPRSAVSWGPWRHTCVEQPASTRRAWCRSRTMTGRKRGLLARSRRALRRRRLAFARALRCGGANRCLRCGALRSRWTPPTLRARRPVLLGSSSRHPPPFQELGPCRPRVDHSCALLIVDDADLERLCVLDGPMYMVTSGSSVSNACQWLRSAWSMSSPVTPCLRALASMSTTCERYPISARPSTHVDQFDWCRALSSCPRTPGPGHPVVRWFMGAVSTSRHRGPRAHGEVGRRRRGVGPQRSRGGSQGRSTNSLGSPGSSAWTAVPTGCRGSAP